MSKEKVILVNEKDEPLGLMEKMEAHRKALLHRAFSIFVFNKKGELLLQQRAFHKYHSGGQWANTCCSHQRENETTLEAAHRRLQEEMGLDTPLTEVFSFIYKAKLDNELSEHEFDHVLFGFYDGKPEINPEEVSDWVYKPIDELQADIENHPEKYTIWLQIALKEVVKHLEESKTFFKIENNG